MKIINVNIEENISIGDVTIGTRGPNDCLYLNINDTYFMEDVDSYIVGYFHKIKLVNFNSILICGLGLGLLPFHCKNNLNITDVNVVDINENLINLINQLQYLNNINIIHSDALEYKSTKKYDLIVGDIWWDIDDNFTNQKDKFISTHLDNLTSNGKIYIPITQEIV